VRGSIKGCRGRSRNYCATGDNEKFDDYTVTMMVIVIIVIIITTTTKIIHNYILMIEL
jgi:hypothetical protein